MENCCSITKKKKSLNHCDSRILIKSRVGFFGGGSESFKQRRDWILRCPYFCPPTLGASAQKSDRCNSNGSLYPSPTALTVVPLAGARFQIPSTTKQKSRALHDFFVLEGSHKINAPLI